MKIVRIVVLMGLVAAGCGDEAGVPSDPCEAAQREPATCEIGSGSALFESIEDGDEIEIIEGAQDGFHVWGSARVTGIHPGDWDGPSTEENPYITFRVTTADGTELSTSTLRRALKVRTDGRVELVGEVVLLDIGSMDEAAWRDATFDVTVRDFCGTTVADSREVVLIPAP